MVIRHTDFKPKEETTEAKVLPVFRKYITSQVKILQPPTPFSCKMTREKFNFITAYTSLLTKIFSQRSRRLLVDTDGYIYQFQKSRKVRHFFEPRNTLIISKCCLM